MQVFLVRHAEAVDDDGASSDTTRPLTPHGRMQATCLGDRLRWYDCAPTHIWSSPLARAVETTDLIVSMMTEPHPVERVRDLGPHGSVRSIAAAMAALPPRAAVLVVGHEPILSMLAAHLLRVDEIEPVARAEALRIVDGRLRWRFAWDADAPTQLR